MKLLPLIAAVILTACNVVHSDTYVPGEPGVKWTEEQAGVIRDKLNYLWDNKIDIARNFDFNNTDASASNTTYLYDPERKLSTVDCDSNGMLCRVYWSSKKDDSRRIRDIAFSEPKAIR